MPRYTLAGIGLVTDVPMPELVESDEFQPAWRFEIDAGPGRSGLPLVHQSLSAEGVVWMEIRGDGCRYALRFPELAEFVVVPDERHISCAADPAAGAAAVRHMLLDQVVPHVLAIDGSLVLHASGMAIDGEAVAFVGPSGFGKSTLVASFAVEGHPLVADDFLLLADHGDRFAALPSYPGLRLWPDSSAAIDERAAPVGAVSEGSLKRRVLAGRPATASQALPFVAIVVLGEPEAGQGDGAPEVSVRRISAREGLMAIYGQAFRMERSGTERQATEFDRFTRLASFVTFLRADYPREYQWLPVVRAAILDALAATVSQRSPSPSHAP